MLVNSEGAMEDQYRMVRITTPWTSRNPFSAVYWSPEQDPRLLFGLNYEIWKMTNQSRGYWQKCQGPWRLIRVQPKEKEEFAVNNLDTILDDKNIGIAIVPFVAENEHRCTWDIICQEDYLEALANQLPEFVVTKDYIPTAPTQYLQDRFRSTRNGDMAAEKVAENEFLDNAVKAIKADSWDRSPGLLYRDAAVRSGLSTQLAIRLLKHEVENASQSAKDAFAKNVLFICLSVIAPLEDNETVQNLQLYRLDEWLDLVDCQEVISGEDPDLHTIATLRRLLRRGQDPIMPGLRSVLASSNLAIDDTWSNETADRQGLKCAAFFRVPASSTFGTFDLAEMSAAMKESVLFADEDFMPSIGSWRDWMSELLSTQEHLEPLSLE